MLKVSNNDIITICRGDSGSFDITLNLGTVLNPDIYEMKDGDKLYFGVMEPNMPFEKALIKKVYTIDDVNSDGTVTITLNPTDTVYLLCGVYYYSIKLMSLNIDDVDVHTIVSKRKFIVEE